MPLAMFQTLLYQIRLRRQVNENDVLADTQASAIGALQSRTSHNAVLSIFHGRVNNRAQGVEPRPPVIVRQWLAAAHFLDVGCRMKVVSFVKAPAELFGHQLADGSFSRAGYAGKDDKHVPIKNRRLRDYP